MRTARIGAALVGAAALLTLMSNVETPAAGQTAARIDLVAQTTFVGAEPAVIDVRVLGAPTGATLSIRVHEAVTTRAALLAGIAGDPPTEVIGQWAVEDIDAARIGAGEVVSVQVPDEEIGELLRRSTDTGAHPLVVELRVGNLVLDSLITHLLVLPPPDQPTTTLSVALLLDIDVPLAIGLDGTRTPDRNALIDAAELTSALAARVEVPVTVQLPPETFDALALAGPDDAVEAAELITTLRTAAVGNSVMRAPWVDVEEEAWLEVGRSDLVTDLYTQGEATLESIAGVASGGAVVLDETAGTATLELLSSNVIGATGFVVHPDAVVGVPDALTAPIVVVDETDRPYAAVVPDDVLGDLVSGADPELAVQHTLAELLRMAMAHDGDRGGVVIAPAEIDLLTLDLFLDGLDRPSPLVPATVDDVLALPPTEFEPGRPVERRIAPSPSEDLSTHALARADLERRLEAYASVVQDTETQIEPLLTLLLASTDDDLGQARDEFLRVVEARVDSGLRGVSLVDTGRITITSRRADLPIVIHSDQTLPITVDLMLSAEKISFPGGERQPIELAPGDNEITLEVFALASGDSAINLSVETPRGAVVLAEGVVRLRSTAISGLGLAISIVALAVLVVWWFRAVRARRRARRESTASVTA